MLAAAKAPLRATWTARKERTKVKTVPICLLLVNGCVVNRNIAPLRFTMRLFTGNLPKQKSESNSYRHIKLDWVLAGKTAEELLSEMRVIRKCNPGGCSRASRLRKRCRVLLSGV